jgi:hypothetical protein
MVWRKSMTEFRCLSYARLARTLMEIYRDMPGGEIFAMAAGVSCPDSGVVEIHKAMAAHRATCDLCKENLKADRRLSTMKRQLRADRGVSPQ